MGGVLTALAAILAMIPLSRSGFWGSMAVAIMGGLLVATVLTILFLPALYALWFRRSLGAGETAMPDENPPSDELPTVDTTETTRARPSGAEVPHRHQDKVPQAAEQL